MCHQGERHPRPGAGRTCTTIVPKYNCVAATCSRRRGTAPRAWHQANEVSRPSASFASLTNFGSCWLGKRRPGKEQKHQQGRELLSALRSSAPLHGRKRTLSATIERRDGACASPACDMGPVGSCLSCCRLAVRMANFRPALRTVVPRLQPHSRHFTITDLPGSGIYAAHAQAQYRPSTAKRPTRPLLSACPAHVRVHPRA